jgi:hypothetical protein
MNMSKWDGSKEYKDSGMKTILRAGLGLVLFGIMGLVFAAQETPAASRPNMPQVTNPKNQTDDEILQESVWRRYFGDNFQIFIGEPTPKPQQPQPGPHPEPFPNYLPGQYAGIGNELEFIEHLWSENDRVDEYKILAKRPYLSEMDQIQFVQSAYSSFNLDRNATEVLIALIVNPCFTEGGRDAILDGLNKGLIGDSNRRKKIFEVLQNRGELLPSPRDPQRWIGYHFSLFQRAINELHGKSIEFDRRLAELEKRTHQLAEFDRRLFDLEKRPTPGGFDFSGFDKRLGALEKRNLQPEEFHKRISVLEGRIQAPVELEKRIAALEKAVQRRSEPGPVAQPAQITELQIQLADLEAKVKQLEGEVKKTAPRPRVPEKGPAPDRTSEKVPD